MQVELYLLDLSVDELPGVRCNICQKLKELNITSVRCIFASSKEVLQRDLGNKTGGPALVCSFTLCLLWFGLLSSLQRHATGQDRRSAAVNWQQGRSACCQMCTYAVI